MTFVRNHFMLIAILSCLAIGGLIGWLVTRDNGGNRPTLSNKEVRQLKQQVKAAQATAVTQDTRGDTARARATTAYAAGKAAETHAIILSAQTHAKPKPLPASPHYRPAFTDSIARFFADYPASGSPSR